MKDAQIASELCKKCQKTICNNVEGKKTNNVLNSVRENGGATKCYKEIYKFCSNFFEQSFKTDIDDMKCLKELPPFNENLYENIIKKFVNSKGFKTPLEYLSIKYDNIFNLKHNENNNGNENENVNVRRVSTSNINFSFVINIECVDDENLK